MFQKIIFRVTYMLNLLIKRFNSKLLNQIDFSKFDYVILFENNIGWGNIMKQRPQQIASNFNSKVLFLYHSISSTNKEFSNITKLKDNLFLLNLDVYRNKIFELLENYNSKYLMIYSTVFTNKRLLKKYEKKGFKLIYEYVDDLSEILNGKGNGNLKKVYDYVVKSDSYITCTSSKLFENVKRDNPKAKCCLVTNGVDYEHFSKESTKTPKDLLKIINKNKPIIGYYGALASWFDYELIKKISLLNKYEIVLLGIKYDGTYNRSGISDLSNVHYLGKKEYDDLPDYANHFDICVIPFLINDITQATSPVKLFEYMALKKPIVTTDMPECRKYSSVLIGKNHKDFIKKLEQALLLKKDKKYMNVLMKDALNNTWISKCSEIINFIKRVK